MAEKGISALSVLALCLALPVQPAAAQEDGWQAELSEQILQEHDCEVAFLSQVTERPVNGDAVIFAKVHCVDKRTFDAYRDSAFEPFEIHICEVPEARSC